MHQRNIPVAILEKAGESDACSHRLFPKKTHHGCIELNDGSEGSLSGGSSWPSVAGRTRELPVRGSRGTTYGRPDCGLLTHEA